MPVGDLQVPPLMANGLKWMRSEIDLSLNRARLLIDQFEDAPQEKSPLSNALEDLRQVEGALWMIRCIGGGVLATELRSALQDCIAGVAEQPEETLAIVSGATLMLSDYLDGLLQGQPDRAAVLQPMISELRLVRGKAAATEADLFVQQMQLLDLTLPVPAEPPRVDGSAPVVAGKLLAPFQSLLLQWLKAQEPAMALARLRKIGDQLAVNAVEPNIYLLWTAYAAAIDSLLARPDCDSLELKRWFGRMGQQLKLLSEQGERVASAQAGEAAWRLIAHAVVLDHSGPRWELLSRALPLADTLPVEPQLSDARRRLRGPNTSLLEKVSLEVRRDLAQIKDDIDLGMRAGSLTAEALELTQTRLSRVAQTLSLLGLPQLQQGLMSQARNLAELATPRKGETRWMTIATTLLAVEHSLGNALARPLKPPAASVPELDEKIPHTQDLREGIAALLREMLVDLAKLKAQLDIYLKGGELRSPDEPAQLLNAIAAGFTMLDRERAAVLSSRLETWVRIAAFPKLRSEPDEAARFAEAVAALELYLEALRDGLPNTGRILDQLGIYIERLRFIPAEGIIDFDSFGAANASAEREIEALLAETEAEVAAASVAAVETPERIVAIAPTEWLVVDESLLDAAPAQASAPKLPAPVVLPDAPTAAAFAPPLAPVAIAAEPDAPVEPAPTAAEDDPEIRAIFIEEASEVLETLQRGLPAFKRAPGLPEAMTDIRRSFHTLKGSGRMVGASLIAEFGWAIEHLLNRCLEGALPANYTLVDVVDRAIALLPALLRQFRDGEDTVAGTEVQQLVARAHFLASGRAPEMIEPDVLSVFREDALDRLGFISQWLSDDPSLPVDAEALRAFHTLKGSGAVVNSDAISQLAGAFEEICAALRESELPMPPAVRALIAEALPVLRDWVVRAGQNNPPQAADWLARVEAVKAFLPPAGEARSSARREAFVSAAFERVQGLEQGLIAWSAAPHETGHAAALAAQAQALQQLAQTQECGALAVPSESLASRLSIDDGQLPDSAFFQVLSEVLEEFYRILDRFREGGVRDGGVELALRLRGLPTRQTPVAPGLLTVAAAAEPSAVLDWLIDPDSELPSGEIAGAQALAPPDLTDQASAEPVITSPAEPPAKASDTELAVATEPLLEQFASPAIPVAASAPVLLVVPPPEQPLDLELTEIFQIEALDLMGELRQGLDYWRYDDYRRPPDLLFTTLHTLKGSARMSGFRALGDAGQWLEDLLQSVLSGERSSAAAHAEITAAVPVIEQAIEALLPGVAVADAQPAVAAADPQERVAVEHLAAQPESIAELAPESPAQLPQHSSGPEQLLDTQPEALLEPPTWVAPTLAMTTPDFEQSAEFAADFSTDELPPEAAEFIASVAADQPLAAVDQPLSPTAPTAGLLDHMEQFRWPLEEGQALGAPVHRLSKPRTSGSPTAMEAVPAGQPSVEIDAELANIFVAEATENLETIGTTLTQWRRDTGDENAVRELQRALHTLKGGARMTGFGRMGDLAHDMETQVSALVAQADAPSAADHDELRGRLEAMEQMHDALSRGHYTDILRDYDATEAPMEAVDFSVEFEEVPALRSAPVVEPEPARGWRPELFWRPVEEDSSTTIRRELARVPVETLDNMLNEAGEISIYRSRLEQQNANLQTQLREMIQTIARLRDQLRSLDVETENQIVARGLNAQSPDQYGQDFDPLEMDRYSRMQELSRALAESVGDLSSLQTSMDEVVDEAQVLLQQQGRINAGVQQGLMSTLMVPFSRQVARLQRVVRQTAQEQGKYAEAVFSGVESELDRNVLERMTAPLEHLLRNAVVHGLEGPEERALADKSPVGTVTVALRREGTQLVMEIADDGRGLDFAAIRRKAISTGLMPPDAELADEDVAQFIFEAGFSTASSLTQSAGRGIGMDVVASEVKQLGGALDLRSVPGSGARFLIRLPLSLALSQSLMVVVGGESYALPLTSIDGIARIPRALVAGMEREGAANFSYGGHDYRLRFLADLIDLPHALPEDVRSLPAVLVRMGEGMGGDRRAALIVDQVLGNREIVSKAVGPQLSAISGVAGATILPNGEVVLILDPGALIVDRARRKLIAEASARAAADAADAITPEDSQLVMVVDDSITMRRVAERLLLRQGFRVITAKDGLDAIAQLQTETPDVILLDIEMPRADGFEVASFVRNSERIRQVPIVMITSRSGEKHRTRAASLGVNRYLIKPYQEDQLMNEMRSVLAEREADRR